MLMINGSIISKPIISPSIPGPLISTRHQAAQAANGRSLPLRPSHGE